MSQFNFSDEEILFIIDKLEEWLSYKEKFESNWQYDDNIDLHQVAIDAQHSSLLPYLLKGGKAHKYPPPKYMSQPVYELPNGEKISYPKLEEDDIVAHFQNSYQWKVFDAKNQRMKHIEDPETIYVFWETEDAQNSYFSKNKIINIQREDA